MSKPDDHSVENEPHLRGAFEPDPSEARAARRLAKPRTAGQDEAEKIEHTVFDEPTFNATLAHDADGTGQRYADHVRAMREAIPASKTWAATWAMALAAGPLAVVATLMSGTAGTWGIAAIVIGAPVVEELMKIVLPLWAVERKPWLMRSRLQIAMCAVAGGIVFAAIENALYLLVYVPNPTPGLIAWRWTVCVFLHAGCTLVSAIGLMKVWSTSRRDDSRPQIALAGPYIIAAMVIHGVYNASAVVLEFTGFEF